MALTGSDSPFISAVIGKPHHCHFSTVGSREIESDKSASDGLGPTVKVLCGSVYYDEWNMSNVSLQIGYGQHGSDASVVVLTAPLYKYHCHHGTQQQPRVVAVRTEKTMEPSLSRLLVILSGHI